MITLKAEGNPKKDCHEGSSDVATSAEDYDCVNEVEKLRQAIGDNTNYHVIPFIMRIRSPMGGFFKIGCFHIGKVIL